MSVSCKHAVMILKPRSSPAIISDTLLEVSQEQHLSNLSSSEQSPTCATENWGKEMKDWDFGRFLKGHSRSLQLFCFPMSWSTWREFFEDEIEHKGRIQEPKLCSLDLTTNATGQSCLQHLYCERNIPQITYSFLPDLWGPITLVAAFPTDLYFS